MVSVVGAENWNTDMLGGWMEHLRPISNKLIMLRKLKAETQTE